MTAERGDRLADLNRRIELARRDPEHKPGQHMNWFGDLLTQIFSRGRK